MKVSLEWITPNAFDLIAKMARVSNPKNENNKTTAPKLIKYLIDNKHWSPLEMVNACVYIECPRDISRQILRHRSFSFQEFSGRYATYTGLEDARELRLRDHKNRQNSLEDRNLQLQWCWSALRWVVSRGCLQAYRFALTLGAAPEVARVLLPEGLVPTRMYMNGTLRSWVHYWSVRCDPATQKEHRQVAEETRRVILEQIPELKELLA